MPRPHLIERLNEGRHHKLTLVSAPAGFGKTTLISAWLAQLQRLEARTGVSWLSLDEADSKLPRFLAYLVTALQRISPLLGEGVLAILESSQPALSESILTGLINDLASVEDRYVLVLDDYHVVDSGTIDEALTFLLQHLPPQMHLVITTREDPQLPLARLRARRQLTEIRVADLRFSIAEAASFLTLEMGLDLSKEDISALERRTEGWIAGLQLAALSLKGREDVSAFIQAFAGDHHFIMDYLVEEVLQRQPKAVSNFLLQTSILERLTGPLCDAVRSAEGEPPSSSILAAVRSGKDQGLSGSRATGLGDRQAAGNEMLQDLVRSNLFVISLDDRRQWYRYHHLFADVLRARLMEEQPHLVPALHLRASRWYAENDMPADAIRHALAAQDFERAANLIERSWAGMDRSRQAATWLGWVKALPERLVRTRPVICAGCAWAYLDVGELETGEDYLRDAERWLAAGSDLDDGSVVSRDEMTVTDHEASRFLPATVTSARAYIAQARGDMALAVSHACRALDLLPESEHLRRGIPASIVGLATWMKGDLETAYDSFAEAISSFHLGGNVLFAITGSYILAEITVAQGRLQKAIEIYEQALQLASEQGNLVRRGMADLYSGMSELHCERYNLEAATEYLALSENLGKRAGLPRWEYRWCLARAQVKRAQGDLDGASNVLDEAERAYVRGPVPDLRTVSAMRARLWIVQGRLEEAMAWAREQGLSSDDVLSYPREHDYLTLARLLLARFRREGQRALMGQTLVLLERLLSEARQGKRMGSVIEALVLQALAHEAQGDTSAALVSLERALTLAAPQGYVRMFLDEELPMKGLLAQADARGIVPDYTSQLLQAFKGEGGHPAPPNQPTTASQTLIEPLSPRELEVLELLAQGLSNREIGERLFLALSTVKGHNSRIYGKLHVRRRTEAVARARELGLL